MPALIRGICGPITFIGEESVDFNSGGAQVAIFFSGLARNPRLS